jgi:transcriptional regulator with XRE-family HTH domain
MRDARDSLEASEQLPVLAGLHRNYVGVLERGGQSPSLDAICKLASALKVKASEKPLESMPESPD